MDYKTKPVSRETLRELSKIIKTKLFRCKNKFYFDVVTSLEKMPLLFNDVSIEIVDDNDYGLKDVPCTTTLDKQNKYVIKIKESVSEGSYHEREGVRTKKLDHKGRKLWSTKS